MAWWYHTARPAVPVLGPQGCRRGAWYPNVVPGPMVPQAPPHTPVVSRSYTSAVESRNAERVRLRVERDKLTATDPAGLADAWAMIEDLWAGTVARARKLPEPVLHEQVEGEWTSSRRTVTSYLARTAGSGGR